MCKPCKPCKPRKPVKTIKLIVTAFLASWAIAPLAWASQCQPYEQPQTMPPATQTAGAEQSIAQSQALQAARERVICEIQVPHATTFRPVNVTVAVQNGRIVTLNDGIRETVFDQIESRTENLIAVFERSNPIFPNVNYGGVTKFYERKPNGSRGRLLREDRIGGDELEGHSIVYRYDDRRRPNRITGFTTQGLVVITDPDHGPPFTRQLPFTGEARYIYEGGKLVRIEENRVAYNAYTGEEFDIPIRRITTFSYCRGGGYEQTVQEWMTAGDSPTRMTRDVTTRFGQRIAGQWLRTSRYDRLASELRQYNYRVNRTP